MARRNRRLAKSNSKFQQMQMGLLEASDPAARGASHVAKGEDDKKPHPKQFGHGWLVWNPLVRAYVGPQVGASFADIGQASDHVRTVYAEMAAAGMGGKRVAQKVERLQASGPDLFGGTVAPRPPAGQQGGFKFNRRHGHHPWIALVKAHGGDGADFDLGDGKHVWFTGSERDWRNNLPVAFQLRLPPWFFRKGEDRDVQALRYVRRVFGATDGFSRVADGQGETRGWRFVSWEPEPFEVTRHRKPNGWTRPVLDPYYASVAKAVAEMRPWRSEVMLPGGGSFTLEVLPVEGDRWQGRVWNDYENRNDYQRAVAKLGKDAVVALMDRAISGDLGMVAHEVAHLRSGPKANGRGDVAFAREEGAMRANYDIDQRGLRWANAWLAPSAVRVTRPDYTQRQRQAWAEGYVGEFRRRKLPVYKTLADFNAAAASYPKANPFAVVDARGLPAFEGGHVFDAYSDARDARAYLEASQGEGGVRVRAKGLKLRALPAGGRRGVGRKRNAVLRAHEAPGEVTAWLRANAPQLASPVTGQMEPIAFFDALTSALGVESLSDAGSAELYAFTENWNNHAARAGAPRRKRAAGTRKSNHAPRGASHPHRAPPSDTYAIGRALDYSDVRPARRDSERRRYDDEEISMLKPNGRKGNPGGTLPPTVERCVAKVAPRHIELLGAREGLSSAIAICTAQGQRQGTLRKGTRTPTARGVREQRNARRRVGFAEAERTVGRAAKAARRGGR